jgi:polyisoprenyl-phosphate glycosyltransferase
MHENIMNNARPAHPNFGLVIPCFNEEETIPVLWQRLSTLINRDDAGFTVVFVDDGSSDGTYARLKDLAGTDARIRVIKLSRNFGHQSALTAGIEHAEGDAVILMDADLQDRPEAISDFISAWRNGADVVYAVRSSRKENPLMRTAFKGFYRLMSKASGIEVPMDAGIFGLLDRRVVDVLRSMPERNRYFPGLRAYAGFKQVAVTVDRDARHSGNSRVKFSGLVKLALDGLIAFSYLPIRMITLVGVVVALTAFGYTARVLYKKLVSGEAIIGWASTLTAILFLGGLQLIMLGLIGEYIGRIYEEVKHRPYYIVMEKVGFDSKS